MNLKTILTCFLLISLAFSASAQNGSFIINGKVLDASGKPVVAANAVLLKDSVVLFKAAVTNEAGAFQIEGVGPANYLLKVTLPGFETYTSTELAVSGNVSLPDIKLQENSKQLEQVAVRAQKPFIEVHADMIVVNVENSIVSAGSSVLEVLARSPGVNVDANDNISLKGKKGVTIMINGKIAPVAGADLANILKSMPSNTIDKIELISNPGARYDAAGTAGIINIRTKKDQKLGMNGSANIAYGQGVYPKINTGLNINYRNKKFNLNVNYSYAYRLWYNHLTLNRRFLDTSKENFNKQQSAYVQDNYAVFDFSNHIGGIALDYNLSSNTTIGVSVNGGVNNFSPKADNFSRALGPSDEVLYYFNTIGRHENSYNNFSSNLYLRHSFDSSGKELSMDADYGRYSNQSNQNFVTVFRSPEGGQYQDPYYMNSDLSGLTQIRSLKGDYVNPLPGNARLDAGFKLSYVTSDSEPLFYETVNGESILDKTRSNHFVYSENVNAGYLNFNKDWKKWSTQVGLRLEQTNVTGDQKTTGQRFDTSYAQLFPSFAIQRHINQNHDLGVTLSRRIERPNYEQLNPFKFFIDKTTYREGYPSLKPSTLYGVELTHTFKQRYSTTLGYSVTSNPITEVIQPSDNDTGKVTVQTNKNLDRMTYYGLSGAWPIPITKWWTNTTNFNCYYIMYKGNIANTNLNSGSTGLDIYTNNTFVLPRDFSAELGLWYQAPQVYGFMSLEPVWMLSAGVQKNLFEKRATVRFSAQDIFWKGYPRATSTYTGYREDFVAERDTRQFTLSFTYRFGKKTVAPVRKRTGGAEDEMRRAGTGGA
jgi:hypothetical protein